MELNDQLPDFCNPFVTLAEDVLQGQAATFRNVRHMSVIGGKPDPFCSL